MRTMYQVTTAVLTLPRRVYRDNFTLWKGTFWDAWESLPLDAKLAWILLISNTLAIITLIEYLVLG